MQNLLSLFQKKNYQIMSILENGFLSILKEKIIIDSFLLISFG